jgi:putative NIF3 family GTP cyclohydrolase 1 type 2
VDTFKAGDSTARVKGVAVVMMATLDVLKATVSKGHNLVITHEPTFYSHRDTTGLLESENDQVLAAKQRYIRDHGLVVWRFHDIAHAMNPDVINAGMVEAVGWERHRLAGTRNGFAIPETTLARLERSVAAKLDAKAVRVVGKPSARVRRVAFTFGFAGFPAVRRAIQDVKPDAVIIGEDHEWESIEYVLDAISAGMIRGLIVLGHVPSEQAGMRRAAGWIRSFVPEVPVEFIVTPDPFNP